MGLQIPQAMASFFSGLNLSPKVLVAPPFSFFSLHPNTNIVLMANSRGLVLLWLTLLMAMASATQFKVGGPAGWSVPGPNAMSYNQWAERNRFQIGDSLLFVYRPDQDSVLQVDKAAYDTCNTTTSIQKFDDGNTVFTFNRSGAFYFISGNEANCLKNESLVVVILADRSNRVSGAKPPISPPSPSPVSSSSPAPSPAASTPPSPPPSPAASSPPLPPPSPAASSPSPPPPSSTEMTPSSSPAGEETSAPPPTPNGASLMVVGFMSSVGAFLGCALFVL